MNKETRQRIEIAKMKIREMPVQEERVIKRRRKPYHFGAKDFLASMEVGEMREHDEKLSWRGLQCSASIMKADYGCMFAFRKINGVKTIFRIK